MTGLLTGIKLYSHKLFFRFGIKLLNVTKALVLLVSIRTFPSNEAGRSPVFLGKPNTRMQPRLTHQVLTSAFKLLHKPRLNITGKFRGAVTWDESVVTVGGPRSISLMN